MEELRNLTKEAIELAKREFLLLNPHLADKEVRSKLTPEEKFNVFTTLVFLGESFEQQLIFSFRS